MPSAFTFFYVLQILANTCIHTETHGHIPEGTAIGGKAKAKQVSNLRREHR